MKDEENFASGANTKVAAFLGLVFPAVFPIAVAFRLFHDGNQNRDEFVGFNQQGRQALGWKDLAF